MSQVELVNHFPLVPASASIVNISSGQVFEGQGIFSKLAQSAGLSNRTGDTYHWSSALENKPSWAILEEDATILHIRGHDCPNPATPAHPVCYDCMSSDIGRDIDFVFTWKVIPADPPRSYQSSRQVPDHRPQDIDKVVQEAGLPIKDMFKGKGPWVDVYRDRQFQLGDASQLLIQHCGACPNPMDTRLAQCSQCVQARTPPGEAFPNADYIMFVKMVRPADGLERQSSFPELNEAINGHASPPRFTPKDGGDSRASSDPGDTGSTRIYRG